MSSVIGSGGAGESLGGSTGAAVFSWEAAGAAGAAAAGWTWTGAADVAGAGGGGGVTGRAAEAWGACCVDGCEGAFAGLS